MVKSGGGSAPPGITGRLAHAASSVASTTDATVTARLGTAQHDRIDWRCLGIDCSSLHSCESCPVTPITLSSSLAAALSEDCTCLERQVLIPQALDTVIQKHAPIPMRVPMLASLIVAFLVYDRHAIATALHP